ncbi:MAG: TSUP family transporter [Acidimicrobiales bacterium]
MLALVTSDYLVLFGAATLAGFVDAIAGGGGLITLPALLFVGVPTLSSLATNKLQGSFGTLVASITMFRKGVVTLDQVRSLVVAAFIGGALGAIVVRQVRPGTLDAAVPVVLVGIAVYFAFTKAVGDGKRQPKMSGWLYRTTIVPVIGFYDGFFGPGTGSFFALSGVSLRGRDLVTSTGYAKSMNFASNIASLLVFMIAGNVWFKVGGIMLVGQLIGATAGSHAAVRGGVRLIRPLIIVVSLATLARYFTRL